MTLICRDGVDRASDLESIISWKTDTGLLVPWVRKELSSVTKPGKKVIHTFLHIIDMLFSISPTYQESIKYILLKVHFKNPTSRTG